MSRSGYSDDGDQWDMIRWRGAVSSAIRGKRGQAFLRDLLAALDAMPEKRLVANSFQRDDGCVCTLGALAKVRGIDTKPLETDYEEADTRRVGEVFGIPGALAAEIMFENDDDFDCGAREDTPARQEQRWRYMREWVAKRLRDAPERAGGR